MNAHRDPDRLIRTFIFEGEEQLQDQVYDAVRAAIERKRQRVVIGPWRVPVMNKFVPIGLSAAAILGVIFLGSRLLAPPSGIGAPSITPSPSPTASVAPTSTPEAGLPEGPFLVTGALDPVQVTLDIPSNRWVHLAEFDGLLGDDDGLDPPQSVGAGFLAWTYPAGSEFTVYGDPCHWSTTIPEASATTPDEIAAALAAQPLRNATVPVDVTVGGYAGKAMTLHVPNDAPDRATAFANCDQNTFASWGLDGSTERSPDRISQGPGQTDELWILDVDGAVVILVAMYGTAAPADLVEEVRAIAESATFE